MNNKKIVLITGAAGGIGEAVSRRFRKEGFSLILVDRNAAALREKFADWSEDADVKLLAVDLEKTDQTIPLRDIVKTLPQGLAAVAFCHGGCIVDSTPFPGIKYWDINYRCNVASCINAIEACIAGLQRGKGNLVLLSSVDAILSLEGAGPYDAAKASLLSLAKSVSRAYSPDVCAIAMILGTVSSQVWDRVIEQDSGALDRRGNENLAGKVISTEEAAGLIWLLCQTEARPMRGQSVIADNGWSFLAGTFRFDQRNSLNPSLA